RFHRIEGARSRTHEGTGIGLALVQELVKLHGGTVSVTSAINRGSTFFVLIPFGARHLPQDRLGMQRNAGSAALHAGTYLQEVLGWLPSEEKSPIPDPGGTVGAIESRSKHGH